LTKKAFFKAVEKGDAPEVERLGAEPFWTGGLDALNSDGMTPLTLAVEKGHAHLVGRLLLLGADVNARNRYGDTPLLSAVDAGYAETVESLLFAGADANCADRHGHTALVRAVGTGDEAVAKALLAAGAHSGELGYEWLDGIIAGMRRELEETLAEMRTAGDFTGIRRTEVRYRGFIERYMGWSS